MIDDPMQNAPLADDPGDFHPGDFHPDDLRGTGESGPPISADFVARTFAQVRDDQARIRDEAARVDDHPLPRAFLDAYAAPPPSPDFVAAALARVRDASQSDLHRLLATYQVPSASADFVQRTFDALREERAPRPALAAVRGPTAGRPLRWRAAAAAALILAGLAAVAFAFRADDDPSAPETGPIVASAQDFTPAVLNTTLERWGDDEAGALRFESVDSLLLLASAGEGQAE